MVKCKYLTENEGKLKFDEIAECPRFLHHEEQCILLDALGVALEEFGSDIQEFVSTYGYTENLLPIGDFFDLYYTDLYKSYIRMKHGIDRCYKVTYTRFLGENY